MAQTMTENREDDEREFIPGGRCYWCAAQDHDGDHCAEAQRIFDEHAERWRRAEAEGGACR